jgi:hypothetical protein
MIVLEHRSTLTMVESVATGGSTGTQSITGDPETDKFLMDQIGLMFFQKFALEKIMEFQAEMKEDDE